MKELMLRVIKDGKIEGHLLINTDGISYSDDIVQWEHSDFMPSIVDSFDMGIKVGDRWWFENDEIYLSDTKKNYFLKYSDNPSWDHWRLIGKSSYRNFNGGNNCERIGSIYDKEEK